MAAIMCQICGRRRQMFPLPLLLVVALLGNTAGLRHTMDEGFLDEQFVPAESTWHSGFANLTVTLPTNATATLVPISTVCDAYIEQYSLAAANFSRCLVQNARPLKVCQQCIKAYIRITIIFDAITTTRNAASGENCADRVLRTNRTEVILQMNGFFEDMWASYHCQNCFSLYTLNSTVDDIEPSNQTVEFFYLTEKFNECLYNISEFGKVPIFPSNMTVNASACRDCLAQYNRLNTFYSIMETQFKKMICVDLGASINNTRTLWNHVLACEPVYGSITGGVILCSVLACLPVIFYVSNKIHGTKIARTVLKQKRLSTVHQSRPSGSHRSRVSGRIL